MPPAVCLSPAILDQSFPRQPGELEMISEALSNIVELNTDGLLYLVFDEYLQLLVEEFAWSPPEACALLQEIYGTLSRLALYGNGVFAVDTSEVEDCDPHPLPSASHAVGNARVWQESVGRLLKLHDSASPRNFFIGIACHMAFSQGQADCYQCESEVRKFPLVGPDTLFTLDDALEWETRQDVTCAHVPFRLAKKNIRLIGGVVEEANGTSHHQVKFNGGRTWPLDINTDPIPERFLRELTPITGLPLAVIKTVLLTGDFPKRTFRLQV